ncbi:MAG: glucosyltransferase domain-containing protein [Lachnospiraceae bacterium]|nr:glucosyltransferase domain-containing protein [Lachnospiraceae bacterium]
MMKTVRDTFENCKRSLTPADRAAFTAAFVTGILTHLPAMTGDFPNHDGLGSLYFDQNMITSGRWFLTVAAGISSYYALPWVIGLLGLLYLSITALLISRILKAESAATAVGIGCLLAVFPSMASMFAYVFTLDGYLLGLLLAVWAVYLTDRSRYGWIPGGILLAFSLGTYQAYLSFAALLCLLSLALLAQDGAVSLSAKWKKAGSFVYMGILGLALYYGILQLLLKIQGRTLSGYQGIGEKTSEGPIARAFDAIPLLYRDFFTFSGSRGFLPGWFAAAAMGVLLIPACAVLLRRILRRKWYRSLWFYWTLLLLGIGIPAACNLLLLMTPEVNYHLIMRFQWVLFPVFALVITADAQEEPEGAAGWQALAGWAAAAAVCVLVFSYGIADNIGYSNLQKKYERTYAYCERLLDRIEQTPGYYQGIPVAMIGVVGEESYPGVDLTGEVTGEMVGLSGDYLVYTSANYEAFIRAYLGATLNFLPPEAMEEIYYSPAYREMGSFPAADSVRIVDGILYVKTENKG